MEEQKSMSAQVSLTDLLDATSFRCPLTIFSAVNEDTKPPSLHVTDTHFAMAMLTKPSGLEVEYAS